MLSRHKFLNHPKLGLLYRTKEQCSIACLCNIFVNIYRKWIMTECIYFNKIDFSAFINGRHDKNVESPFYSGCHLWFSDIPHPSIFYFFCYEYKYINLFFLFTQIQFNLNFFFTNRKINLYSLGNGQWW